ncbi:MAG: carbonic anhydrase [Candidatus Solibacter usitatus]|nr:carbonic anhydrase [Candidatus Solibacter usitatus]
MKAILEGLKTFQTTVYERHRELFERLRTKQDPQVLFITCADSRVVPNLIVQAEPGDLFTVRNAGNIVPPRGQGPGGVSASIEYAVEALGVRDIILCGHSNCGAMRAILHPETVAALPNMAAWVRHAEPARKAVERLYPGAQEEELMERMVEQNVIQQVKNLLTHEWIAERVRAGRLDIHGWVYDIGTGRVRGLDESGEGFCETAADAPGSPEEKLMLFELENPG